jgi:hypothetical protein
MNMNELDVKAFEYRVKSKLSQVFNDFTGAETTPDSSLIIECTKFLIRKYGHMRSSEITMAFQMASSGELTLRGKVVTNEIFKRFTVEKLGQILQAYDLYRGEVIRQNQTALAEQEVEEKRVEHERLSQEAGERMIREFKAAKANNSIKEFAHIPLAWRMSPTLNNLLTSSPDLWDKAKAWATASLKSEAQSIEMTIRIAARSELDKAEQGKPDRWRTLAEIRYKDLVLCRELGFEL